MKKLTKMGLVASMILTALVLFTGCEKPNIQKTDRTRVDINMGVNIYCDKTKNVEYMIFKGYKSGGMTPRLNADGTVSTCSK